MDRRQSRPEAGYCGLLNAPFGLGMLGGGPDGTLIEATTADDRTFVLRCVPHGNWGVWTDWATPTPITVPPQGLWDVVIRLGCADVVGTVTDADTGQPIAGAKAKVFGSGPGVYEATSGPDGSFRIQCVSPAGARFLRTTAPGYLAGNNSVNVPAAGNSAPIAIQLRRVVTSEIRIVLNWGPQPSDLDSHLSGPDGAGGRFPYLVEQW
jgi:hypothetical protein